MKLFRSSIMNKLLDTEVHKMKNENRDGILDSRFGIITGSCKETILLPLKEKVLHI